MAGPDLARLLGSLTVAAEGAQAHQRPAGGCHQIVDFVSSSLFVEEAKLQVEGGVTLKLNCCDPKLSKLSNPLPVAKLLDESGKNC